MSKIRLSIDDGCASDVRLADLARKYEVEAIFYWPVDWQSIAYSKGYEPLSYIQALQIAQQFEIGSHTVTHRHLTSLEEHDAYKEMADSQMMLARLFQQPIRKFCPPRGYTNRTLQEYTLSLYDTQRLTKGRGLVHIHPNSGANDNKPWRECINDDTKELWGHSWEFDKYDLWDELEDFLREYQINNGEWT